MKKFKNIFLFIISIFSMILSSCFIDFNQSSDELVIEEVEITFYDWDENTIIYQTTIEKGSDASFSGTYPSHYLDDKYGEFVSWDKPLENIMEDTSFYPVFEYSYIYYTVNFFDEDEKTLLDTFQVKKNDSIVYDKIPTKESDLYNDYKFDGWYNYKGEDFDNITSNLNFFATYETIPHSYTARFYNHDGFLLQSSIVKKGEYAEYTGQIPTKEGREDGEYVFHGFSPSVENTPIEQDTDFTALFLYEKYTYKVVFKDEDGTILCETEAEHGKYCYYPYDEPTKECDEEGYYYDLFNWNPSGNYGIGTVVTEDREYTASYMKYKIHYTVTFDTLVNLKEYNVSVAHGDTVSPIKDLEGPDDGYTRDFLGWDYDFSIPITSDTYIKAIWSDWYYTKDGLTYHLYVDEDTKDNCFTVSYVNTNYRTFMISYKNIAIKDEDGKFQSAYITGVAKQGFYNNDVVRKVVFDDISTLKIIGYEAFSRCDNLETVILNEYITRIEDYAFYDCESLKTVYLPASIEYIGKFCFAFSGEPEVFYKGTPEQFENIETPEATHLGKNEVYFYSETKPIDSVYKYWHYVDGKMTPWE